jgi:hypothetical protein
MQQPYNTQALEGHVYVYQSVTFFNHKVFKNQGQVPFEKLDFYLNHYQQGGKIVVTSPEYLGDRINEDRSRFGA